MRKTLRQCSKNRLPNLKKNGRGALYLIFGQKVTHIEWVIIPKQINIQWVPELLERADLFHVNKSCKIECCSNKTHQIIQNMILSRGLELKLSLL